MFWGLDLGISLLLTPFVVVFRENSGKFILDDLIVCGVYMCMSVCVCVCVHVCVRVCVHVCVMPVCSL